MYDTVDTKHDVLYCSRKCAIKDGCDTDDLRPMFKDEYEKRWEEGNEAGEGNPYGALCPTCETEYHCF